MDSSAKFEETLVNNIRVAKEYFLSNQVKSGEYREKKFEQEYKDCLVKKNLMLPSKFESFLKAKHSRELINLKDEASSAKVSTQIETYTKDSVIKQIPEKYRINSSQSSIDNSNLMLSIYKNSNQLSFKSQDDENEVDHKKWKLYRVISGHTGWVRCIDFDPTNSWFVTGSTDKVIKFWDLASGSLKISLTGHINTVRGVVVSTLSPYLYSCGEDRMIKCWDLEQNKVTRSYHGHLSGVYSIAAHPRQNIIASGGRDCCVRIWDVRTKAEVGTLEGHSNTVSSVICSEYEPQIISASHDSTIRFIDLRNMKTLKVITNHKKSIRSLCLHDYEKTLVSGGCDNVKTWTLPEGLFKANMKNNLNFNEDNSILNTVTLNKDNVLVGGTDSGHLRFWDCKSGKNFQNVYSSAQPGSLNSESGIFCAKFDLSSSRLITGECDKTIKMWKEEDD